MLAQVLTETINKETKHLHYRVNQRSANLQHLQLLRHFKRIRDEQLAKKAAAEEALGIAPNSASQSFLDDLCHLSKTRTEVKTSVVPKKERSPLSRDFVAVHRQGSHPISL